MLNFWRFFWSPYSLASRRGVKKVGGSGHRSLPQAEWLIRPSWAVHVGSEEFSCFPILFSVPWHFLTWQNPECASNPVANAVLIHLPGSQGAEALLKILFLKLPSLKLHSSFLEGCNVVNIAESSGSTFSFPVFVLLVVGLYELITYKSSHLLLYL